MVDWTNSSCTIRDSPGKGWMLLPWELHQHR
jgi:hypothetical protein